MKEGARKQNILLQWFSWQFLEVPKGLLLAWKNFLLFGFSYFSVPLLFKTWFSPWRRYTVSYGRGFDLGRWSEAFLSNLVFRILGAIVRTIFIGMGLVAEVFILFFGLSLFLIWLLLPFILILGIYHGFRIFL